MKYAIIIDRKEVPRLQRGGTVHKYKANGEMSRRSIIAEIVLALVFTYITIGLVLYIGIKAGVMVYQHPWHLPWWWIFN
jgi:hypothetical protein